MYSNGNSEVLKQIEPDAEKSMRDWETMFEFERDRFNIK